MQTAASRRRGGPRYGKQNVVDWKRINTWIVQNSCECSASIPRTKLDPSCPRRGRAKHKCVYKQIAFRRAERTFVVDREQLHMFASISLSEFAAERTEPGEVSN